MKTDPFSRPRQVALYQMTTGSLDYVYMAEYVGDQDARQHPAEAVRISEPIEVTFRPLANKTTKEALQAALSVEETRLVAETEARLQLIRQRRESLAAEA